MTQKHSETRTHRNNNNIMFILDFKPKLKALWSLGDVTMLVGLQSTTFVACHDPHLVSASSVHLIRGVKGPDVRKESLNIFTSSVLNAVQPREQC